MSYTFLFKLVLCKLTSLKIVKALSDATVRPQKFLSSFFIMDFKTVMVHGIQFFGKMMTEQLSKLVQVHFKYSFYEVVVSILVRCQLINLFSCFVQ